MIIKYHFTHTYQPIKKKSFITRGINTAFDFTAEEMQNELIRAGFPIDTIITEHITGYMRINTPNSALFRIVVPANFDENLFKQIKSIFGVIVKFVKFHSKSTTQCNNCQRFFHTGAGCHHQFRCVKCIQPHRPGACNKSDDAAPQCINCSGFHTANNINACDYYKNKILPIIEKKKKNNTNNNNTKSNNNTARSKVNHANYNKKISSSTRISYADTLRANSSSTQNLSGSCDLLRVMMEMIKKQDTIISKLFENGHK